MSLRAAAALAVLVVGCVAFSSHDLPARKRGDSTDAPARLTADIAGTEVSYVEVNEGSHSGVVAVLLHGARFSAQTWIDLGTMLILKRHGVHAIAVDLPGYGQSAGQKGSMGSAPSKAAWLAQLLEHLAGQGSKVVLVSPSMSGSYAVPYLQEHGDEGIVTAWMPVAPVGVSAATTFPPHVKSKVDVLSFYGQKDPKLPDADILLSVFHSSRKVVVPNGSHPCYLDDPGLFHSELLALVGAARSRLLGGAGTSWAGGQ